MIDLSDPISRQQTITALRALSDDDGYINAPHEVVTDVVRGLPPVQAKHEQITHSEQGETDKLGVETGETYKDMISRQDAIYALDEIESEVTDGYGFQYEKWRKYFTELPSAPERKTGKWIKERIYGRGKHRGLCSCCGFDIAQNYKVYKFCPNCGSYNRGR